MFKITFPITKTEKLEDGRMIVRGIATSDAIDKQGERLLFDGSVKAFTGWMETGPAVREQHDPTKAVGAGLNFTPMPEDGAIAVEVFVSAAEKGTQTKLDEKVLRAFSIGGTPKNAKMVKAGDKIIKEISEWEMEELSIVDRPANPDCQIMFTKAGTILETKEGDVTKKKTAGAEPEETDEETAGKPAPKDGEETLPEKKPEGGEGPEGEEGGGAVTPPPDKGGDGQERGLPKPSEGGAPVKLDKEDMAQIVASVTDAVLAAMKEQKEALKEETAKAVKAAVGAFRKADSNQIVIWDLRLALDCLDMLTSLLSYEEGEEAGGAKEPPEQRAALKAAIKSLSAFLVSEAGELLTEDDVILASSRPIKILKSSPAQEGAVKDSPETQAKLDALTKAVETLRAEIGGAESFRDAVGKLEKGIATILSMPVPGRAPVKFAAAAPALSSEGTTEATRILENMLAKADPLSRPAIERELNFLRQRSA